jgi:hypothetical protein
MSDSYLWDRSGDPDPEIVRLEEALAPLRLDPPLSASASRAAPAAVKRRRWRVALVGAGLSCAAAAGVALWFAGRASLPPPEAPVASVANPAAADAPPWLVAPLAGAPRVANVAVHAAGPAPSGALIETDGQSRARISMGDIGQVEIERGTRLRLVSAGPARHRLGLERGVMHALIWAPAGRLSVETTAGVLTDLGCAYTLSMDDAGRGLVTVSAGWVGFEYRGRESLIPVGATAILLQGRGPGTPLLPQSPARLRDLVMSVDAAGAEPPRDAGAFGRQLAVALRAARPEDAVTLWHLLDRLPAPWRAPVHDRLAALAPPPPAVSRAGIVAGNAQMRDSWWDVLGHGPIADWRYWKASIAPVATP